MGYLELVAIALGLGALGYFKRHGFRRAWYVLRTGDEKPNWEKLGAEYFLGRKAKDRKSCALPISLAGDAQMSKAKA